ncbi:MAG: PAS domain-containing protein [Lentisphaerae bacterium]|nr:PAS domain-containing protein [Lentisphaerota bacterium]
MARINTGGIRGRRGVASCRGRLAAACAGVVVAVLASCHPGAPSPRLLLINSYSPDSPWSAALTAGVREAIAAAYPQAELRVRYLPEDSADPAAAAAALEADIAREHGRSPYAAVIAADDAAFAFAMATHDRLLHGVPVVFCGVSDLPPNGGLRRARVTGTIRVHDVSTVVASALKRHPSTRALVVVHDLSPAGLAYRDQMQSWAGEMARRRPGLGVVFLSAERYATSELIEQIRVLPADCLVLLTSWSRDRDGLPQHLDDVLARIARVSPVPVYGASGGQGLAPASTRLAEAHRQGTTAGAMVVKILQGVPPSEIPIRVVRADLEPSLSPPPSARASTAPAPPPAAADSRRHGWALPTAVALGLLLQGSLLAALVWALRQRLIARREVEALRHRLDQIVEGARLRLFEWDLDAGTLTCNSRYAEALGYLPEELPATRMAWEALVHPDDLPRVLEALDAYLDDHASTYAVTYRLRNRAGLYCQVHERGEVALRHADGTPARLLGVHVDVVPAAAAAAATPERGAA